MADQDAKRAELRTVRQNIDRLVDARAAGAAVRDRLASLEERRIALEADLAVAVAPAPRPHPNLAEVYRQRVAVLSATHWRVTAPRRRGR